MKILYFVFKWMFLAAPAAIWILLYLDGKLSTFDAVQYALVGLLTLGGALAFIVLQLAENSRKQTPLKQYHFYFDEGGMIGQPKVLILDRKLKLSKNYADISNYYFGYMSEHSIKKHLILWVALHSGFRINFSKDSVVSMY